MHHGSSIVVAVVLGTLSGIGCSAGRQASWEKASTQEQIQSATDTTPNANPDEAPKKTIVEKANEAWGKRADRKELEKAIGLWEQATSTTDIKNPHTLTQLSRAYYLLADGYMRIAGENDAMLNTFEKGISMGERAMMASSQEFAAKVKAGERVEDVVILLPASAQAAIYWYATNLGKFAVAKGFGTILFYKDRIFAVMQRVLSIDETFFHAAPHRYFGAFYAKAPSFAGGDMKKSKEHFEKALSLDDAYLGTKVLYAQYWAVKSEDKALFTSLLNDVKVADPAILPQLIPEQKIEQQKAITLLGQTSELF